MVQSKDEKERKLPSGRATKAEIERANTMMFNSSWISGSPSEFRTALLSLTQWRRHDPGDVLARPDDTKSDIFGLASGTMAFTTVKGPPATRLTHIMHPGDWFGVVPILTGGGRSGEISLRTTGLVARVPGGAIKSLLAEQPRWWREIGRLSVLFAQIAAGAAADLMVADNRQRCAATLLRLAGVRHRNNVAGTGQIVAQVSQDELGAVANLSRNSVGRILKELEALGLVVIAYRSITLPDPESLRRMVDC